MVRLGPWTFRFWPDGDDPGVGLVDVYDRDGELVSRWSATRVQWEEFSRDDPGVDRTSGQALIEYALIVSLICLVVVTLLRMGWW